MLTKDFDYYLPQDRIAQTPAEPRDHSRLLVYDRKSGRLSHRFFYDLPQFLQKGDLLVVNNTRVIPARLLGNKMSPHPAPSGEFASAPLPRRGSDNATEVAKCSHDENTIVAGEATNFADDGIKTGARIEFLLVRRLDLKRWEVMAKPGKKAWPGTRFEFGEGLTANVLERTESGGRIIKFEWDGVFEEVLSRVGTAPLPHYIKKAADLKRYNTVYGRHDGSCAAPTAGLHFTDELLSKLRGMGVETAEVLLHVGPGTFRPVKSDEVEGHVMHSEYIEVSRAAAEIINRAKSEGRRVICVGTTSVRATESAAKEMYNVAPAKTCLTDQAMTSSLTDKHAVIQCTMYKCQSQCTMHNAQCESQCTMHSEQCAIKDNPLKNSPPWEGCPKGGVGRPFKAGQNDGNKVQSVISEYFGETSIFIYPPYKFAVADGLITNFHLPQSTLLMLVSAFLENGGGNPSGRENVLEIYKTALEEKYRFYSFGDAMLIL